MQTVYCSTRSFIRHQGNVVDLNEYRRKLAQAQLPAVQAPPPGEARPRPSVRRRASRRRKGLADWLDMTATLSVTAVAVTLCLQFLL